MTEEGYLRRPQPICTSGVSLRSLLRQFKRIAVPEVLRSLPKYEISSAEWIRGSLIFRSIHPIHNVERL